MLGVICKDVCLGDKMNSRETICYRDDVMGLVIFKRGCYLKIA